MKLQNLIIFLQVFTQRTVNKNRFRAEMKTFSYSTRNRLDMKQKRK